MELPWLEKVEENATVEQLWAHVRWLNEVIRQYRQENLELTEAVNEYAAEELERHNHRRQWD